MPLRNLLPTSQAGGAHRHPGRLDGDAALRQPFAEREGRARAGQQAKSELPSWSAELVPDATREIWTTRGAPSRIEGVNISADELSAIETKEEAESHVVRPLQPVARNAPSSVSRAGRGLAPVRS